MSDSPKVLSTTTRISVVLHSCGRTVGVEALSHDPQPPTQSQKIGPVPLAYGDLLGGG